MSIAASNDLQRFRHVIATAVTKLQLLDTLSNVDDDDKVTRLVRLSQTSLMNEQAALKDGLSKHAVKYADYNGKLKAVRLEIKAVLEQVLSDLESGSKESLQKYIKEQQEQEGALVRLKAREQDLKDQIAKLKQDLQDEEKRHQEKLKANEEQINVLKDTLQELQQLSIQKQKFLKKEHFAKECSMRQKMYHEESLVQRQISEIDHQIQHEQKAHEIMISFLHSQRDGTEKALEEWMNKYETDVEEKALELESFKLKKNEMLDKFENLQLDYEKVAQTVSEHREKKRREEEAALLLFRQTRAVMKIQRWWRMKQASKKKKKGKGKGKKKK